MKTNIQGLGILSALMGGLTLLAGFLKRTPISTPAWVPFFLGVIVVAFGIACFFVAAAVEKGTLNLDDITAYLNTRMKSPEFKILDILLLPGRIRDLGVSGTKEEKGIMLIGALGFLFLVQA